MKKLILFILFVLFCSLSYSQIRFNKYYDNKLNTRISDLARDFIQLSDSGYLIPSRSFDLYKNDTLGYAKSYLQIFRTDKIGDTIFHRIYEKKLNQFAVGYIAKMNSNHFLLAGFIIDLVKYHNDTIGSKILLVKINDLGDTLWTKNLDIGDGDEFATKLINTNDGGFAIVGQVCDKFETNCDVFLMKLDSNANMQWYKTFTWAENFWENPTSLIQTKTNEYILTSATADMTTVQYYGYIIKTDSDGNLLWQKKIDNEGNYYGYFEGITMGQNNTYLFSGIIGDNRPFYSITKGWILRTDTSGNYIQNIKIGDENKYTYFRNILEINNKIVVQGATNNYSTLEYQKRTCLYSFTSSGEKIWRRVYQDSLISNSTYITYNMKQTFDGGYAMIGFGRNPKDSINIQDVWFMKVDSMGCLYESCIALGLDEDKTSLSNSMKIYPNPASTFINIETEVILHNISIMDMLGKVVYQSEEVGQREIDLDNFSKGVYILRARDVNGVYYSQKFMVGD